MKRNANEMYFQLIALLMGFILIHAIFVTLVRPNAESAIRQQVERAAAGEPYIVPRSFYVVIKDVEQRHYPPRHPRLAAHCLHVLLLSM